MKTITLFLLTILTISCGNNKEEQMLYDFQSNNIKEILNTDLKELDFKINSIEKIGEIKSSDSLLFLKNKLALLWFGDDATEKEKDTLSYDFVIKELDSSINYYNSIILSGIKVGNEFMNYDEYKDKRDNATDAKYKTMMWKYKAIFYSEKPDSILSVKYKANYSIMNPMLNVKQTFDKIYYTDASRMKFIKEVQVE